MTPHSTCRIHTRRVTRVAGLLCLLTIAVLKGGAIVGVTAAEDPGSVDTAATLADGSERADSATEPVVVTVREPE